MNRRRRALISFAVAAVTATAAIGASSASANTTYTQTAIAVTLSAPTSTGATASATTTVKASVQTTVAAFGVCVRDAAGRNFDFWKRPGTLTTTGTASPTDTKPLPNGTYSAFACVNDGQWRNVAGTPLQFSVGAVPTTPPATPTPSTSSTTPTPSPSAAPSDTPSPSEPSPTLSTAAPTAAPQGPGGEWSLAFDDEFNGTKVENSKWDSNYCKTMNKVLIDPANTTVADGIATLRLAGGKGAMLTSSSVDQCPSHPDAYFLPVGGYAEARINFGKTDAGYCANWPAWWASGPSWPAAGEHDIAEVLSGQLTVNYHSSSGAHNQGAIPGTWCGGWHTYGLHRKPNSADVYWDGKIVKSYPTDDNGQPESLILNIGASGSHPDPTQTMQVDYVRAWRNAV